MVPQRPTAARSAESKAAPRDGRQEGGSVSSTERQSESKAPAVSARTTQGAKTHGRDWTWVEASVWKERMLAALENGVKGGKWYSLIKRWPKAFFADLGLFTMTEAHTLASRSR